METKASSRSEMKPSSTPGYSILATSVEMTVLNDDGLPVFTWTMPGPFFGVTPAGELMPEMHLSAEAADDAISKLALRLRRRLRR